MSDAGVQQNSNMYGGTSGQPVSVTTSGNIGTWLNYDNIVNVGRVLLRAGQLYQFPDVTASGLKIYAAADNGNVWLGGTGDQAPQVNVGYPIVGGATLEIPCINSNLFSVIPEVDGDSIYLIVYGVSTSNLAIDPGNPTPIDRVPPSIVSFIPANGTVGVPINQLVSVLFDKALDPTTINSTNVLLTPDVTPLAITTIPDSTNPANILITYTGANLPSFTNMTISVSNIMSASGYEMTGSPQTSGFQTSNTTTPPNPTPPTKTGSTPASGATNVLTSISPIITFSLPVNPSTVTSTSVTIINTDTSDPVTGFSLSLSADLKTLTIGSLSLTGGVNYAIGLSNAPPTGIQSVYGVYLDQTYSIPFTTKLPYTIVYNVAGNGYINLGLWSGGAVYACEFMASGSSLIGKVPLYFTFVLRCIGGGLAGTVTFKWRRKDSHGNTVDFKTIGSMAASAVPINTDTTYTFNMASNTTPFQLGDSVGIAWESGNASFHLQTRYSTSEVFDGTKTYYSEFLYNASGDVSQDITTADLAMSIGVS